MSQRTRFILPITILAACGGTRPPGAHPHDMSAREHDREATSHEATAAEHEARYEPGIADPCDPRLATCWTAMRTGTEQHRDEAEHHARVAAAHRRASAALREAEASACAGVSSTDRDTSPFLRIDDISRVEPLTVQVATGAGMRTDTLGAVVSFRAVPGMTAPRLQRIIDCHLARNAALGHAVPELPDCPLVPHGARAIVRPTGETFAVEIRGDDIASAQEILARAKRLRPDRTATP